MAITVSGTSITFNDGTTQTTAASGGAAYAGPGATVYTTAGSFTFTIPSGITKLKVTVVGGGGGAFSISGCSSSSGGTGGTSSVSSGTQTISTVSATGGAGGSGSTNVGGSGSGGDLNSRGAGTGSSGTIGGTGSSILSFVNTTSQAGILGAGGSLTTPQSGGAGGGAAIKWLTGLTAGNTLSVTVGAGGTCIYGSQTGGPGAVIFEY